MQSKALALSLVNLQADLAQLRAEVGHDNMSKMKCNISICLRIFKLVL